MKKNIYIPLSISFVAGVTIWKLSPAATGYLEPWDSENYYYSISLILSGACVGFFFQNNIWSIYIGLLGGQLAYVLIFLPKGPLLPLGIILLGWFTWLAFVSGFCASIIKRKIIKQDT